MKEGLVFYQKRITESSTQDEECSSGVRFARLELGFPIISCWCWIFEPHLPYVEGLTAPTCGRDHDASIMHFHLHPAFLGSPAVRRGHISDLWMITGRGGGSDRIPLSGLPKTFSWPSTSSLPSTLNSRIGKVHHEKGGEASAWGLKVSPRRCCQWEHMLQTWMKAGNKLLPQCWDCLLQPPAYPDEHSTSLRGGWNTYSKIKSTW